MKTNSTITTIEVALLAVMMLAMGCKKTVKPKVPMVTLLENAVAIGYDKAVLCAEVTDNGGAEISERGFCYGKEDGPMDTVLCNTGSDPFSAELTGLSPLTTYTCQAFAGNEAGRGYSSMFRFTTELDTIPRLKTWYVREITQSTAIASGQVLGSGGQTVMERGICYDTISTPTLDGKHVEAGTGVGSFDCPLTELSLETRYYVRAYAVCTKGVYYGEVVDFDTRPLPMEVRTLSVSDMTASRLKAEGEVIRNGGLEVTECGFCWGTEHHPTVEGLHYKAPISEENFSCYFSGLERGRTNYVRAYAVNKDGVAYGDEIEIVPDDPYSPWPGGVSPGLFSVSEDRQVRFSQGNLQYHPDDNKWRFAEHQWDFVGGACYGEGVGDMNVGTVYANGAKCDNTKVWKYYEGWVDLFGWGTSGWDNGNEYYHPYDNTAYQFDCTSYGPLGNYDLAGPYAEADWGIHNTISNGGLRQWRTPTADELLYLLTERLTPSGMRFAMAMVAGVRGMIVLPDNWNEATYPLSAANELCNYSTNTITGREWYELLEPAGAVFMPGGGERFHFTGSNGIYFDWFDNENAIDNGGYMWINSMPCAPFYVSGSYWTSSQYYGGYPVGVSNAVALKIKTYESGLYDAGFMAVVLRCKGYSVRLVSDE